MKFLLKRLRFFFPIVFPIYIGFPGPGGGWVNIKRGEVEAVNILFALKKQVEELTARVKELEEKLADSEEKRKDPEKYFWTH
jgi:hypothetical protein